MYKENKNSAFKKAAPVLCSDRQTIKSAPDPPLKWWLSSGSAIQDGILGVLKYLENFEVQMNEFVKIIFRETREVIMLYSYEFHKLRKPLFLIYHVHPYSFGPPDCPILKFNEKLFFSWLNFPSLIGPILSRLGIFWIWTFVNQELSLHFFTSTEYRE